MRRIGYGLCGLILLCSFFGGCAARPLTRSGYALDTIVTVTIYDAGRQDALDAAFDTIDAYEALWSKTTAGSDTARINAAAAGEPVAVSDETIELLVESLGYGGLSGGLFTVTIGPVSALWDFASETPSVPDAASLRDALARVGDERINVGLDMVTQLEGGAQIDLGGIAKGAIADKVADTLRALGVRHAIVNLGGNVYALGGKMDGKPFTIGLQSPFDMSALMAAVDVSDMAVVTSGVYQRSFTQDGVLYHHLLDRRTGYPMDNGLAAVTVICPSALRADALSTTLFLLGEEEGLSLCESLDDVEAVFTKMDGSITLSSGMGTIVPYVAMTP